MLFRSHAVREATELLIGLNGNYNEVITGRKNFSEAYTDNRWADWKISVRSMDRTDAVPVLYRDGEAVTGGDWLIVGDDGSLRFLGTDRTVLWCAGPKDTRWEMKAFDQTGQPVPCRIDWAAEYQG